MNIIRDGVKIFTDEQERERSQLKELATRYDAVADFLEEEF